MKISYFGSTKNFYIFQNGKKVGKINKKNKSVEVKEGKAIIKEIITGIFIVDFFIYGILGFMDIFSNYVDGELQDCTIFLITNEVDVTGDLEIDDYGMCKNAKYKLRKLIFGTSCAFYTILFSVILFLLIFFGIGKEKAITSVFTLIGLIILICYFYIIVNLIHTYNRYKKFIMERIGGENGK